MMEGGIGIFEYFEGNGMEWNGMVHDGDFFVRYL